jgi:choline-glycine betaine transporter
MALACSFYDSPSFVRVLDELNQAALSFLSPWFAAGALFALLLCLYICVSPLAKVKIGGPQAKPLLGWLSWCSVSLCTNTAIGILFWAIAEPIFHLSQPPSSLGLKAGSLEAAQFALSTLYLHWSFTPAAIYTLPALMFAFAFYNMRLPFSLSSPLVPLIGEKNALKASDAVDATNLFCLVAGMAASLATGVLTLAGGLESQWGISSEPITWVLIGFTIVAAFILAAASGLQRGVAALSNFNMALFLFLAGYLLLWGPTTSTLTLSRLGLQDLFSTYVGKSLFLSFNATDPWPKLWTVFYWSVWLAWAPMTAVFLGRIGVGYTVRAFVGVNLFIPALFALVWMSIFGGTALSLELFHGAGLKTLLETKGSESLVYAVFHLFPGAVYIIPVFLFTAFVAYVTGANSNTMAMASMSSHGMEAQDTEPALSMKILWGTVVGAVALTMLCLSGIGGIKTLSYLGGIPALFYEWLVGICLLRVALRPRLFDKASHVATDKAPSPEPLLPLCPEQKPDIVLVSPDSPRQARGLVEQS